MIDGKEKLRGPLEQSGLLDQFGKEYKAGDLIVTEGEKMNHVSMVVTGSVSLFKQIEGRRIELHRYEEYDFFGALTLFLDRESHVSMIAITDCKLMEIPLEKLRHIKHNERELYDLIYVNIFDSLARRFAAMSTQHVELHKEQQQLIHHERMITLGKLLSGITHEINNPLVALIRSLEHFEENLKKSWEVLESEKLNEIFDGGKEALPIASTEARERMIELRDKYEDLTGAQARVLARGTDDFFESFIAPLLESENFEEIDKLRPVFEMGAIYNSMVLSSTRIKKLVQGIKRSVKFDMGEKVDVDIYHTISETLVILQNMLTDVEVSMKFDKLPVVLASPNEICNVWTNIIVNACEAMDNKGKIYIEGEFEKENNMVVITISDTGHGIPEDKLEKIFESNFTTKNTSQKFGLGLGMAYSKTVISRTGGRIYAENYDRGARLIVRIPGKIQTT